MTAADKMATVGVRIPLLEAEPELARFMSAEEQEAAAKVSVPVARIARGAVDIAGLLDEAQAFGGFLLEGMLFSHHRVGEQTALRLLGPGDVIALPGEWGLTVQREPALTAAAPTTIALFGDELLLAARRWPRMVAGLHVRIADQLQRVATQLTICQLPRVDQRLLAIMWLLAEYWGHVTSAGTRLPLSLTHDALGALVGARRPTVTLALGQLVERGAIVRQERGWLLLEAPVEAAEPPPAPPEQEVLLQAPPSPWDGVGLPQSDEEAHDQLVAAVKRLRQEHLASREVVVTRLAELALTRRRTAEVRQRIAAEALRRRQVPS